MFFNCKYVETFGVRLDYLIKFLKNPNQPNYLKLSKREKLIDICFYYLIISILIGSFLLWYPVEIAENLGFFNELKEVDFDMGIYLQIASAIILAPLFEEGLFRLFLGYYRQKIYFKWLFYISAIVFGQIHITNYKIDATHYLFVPFITLTQTFGGLMLGFIRITYGFWYGVLLHALFNLFVIIWNSIADL